MNPDVATDQRPDLEPETLEVPRPWHQMPAAEVLDALQSPPQGLATAEVQRRLVAFGPNELTQATRRTPWRMFFEQFADFMIVVLLVAAVISGLVGEAQDTIAIIVIVIVNAAIGFIQEYRA